MKKFFATIIFFVMLATISVAAAESGEPTISASSAILVDAATGRIIYEKNSNTERPPASMTKMLTAIIALENLDPSSKIDITDRAVYTEDSTLDWAAGDSLSALDVVNAVLIVSENGGAVALAQAVAGSEREFAEMMNAKAAQIGCKNSHFVNPNGLPNDNHYSTAADMARIAVYCLKNPDFRKIIGTQRTSIHWHHPKNKWAELRNTNALLGNYKGANGVKTGWTNAAGGCLTASAKRGNVELIAVVMNSENEQVRFDDATALLNYGFERVRMVSGVKKSSAEKTIFVRGGKRAKIRVKPVNDLDFPLLAGEDEKLLGVTYELPKIVDAGEGIDEGEVLGEAVLRYDGKPVARVPLVARDSVKAGFSFGSFIVGIAALFV